MKHSTPPPRAGLFLAACVVASIAVIAAPLRVGAQDETSYTPSPRNFQKWLEFISPNEDERSFERIGWRNQFWPAVEEARRLGRPILLWTMNGHPLGCT